MAADNTKIIYGGDMMIFIGDTTGTTTPLAFSTSASLSINVDTREISSKDSGYWKDFIAGKISWEASTDGLLSYGLSGSTSSVDVLFTKLLARESVYVKFATTSGTTPAWTVNSSKKVFTGKAIITSLELTASDNESSTYTISLTGSEALSVA